MRFLIASDLHGSATAVRKLMDHIDRFDPDRILLLGDLLYHGPRNALPDGYDTMAVAGMLNSVADRIIAVQGNCDAEVDQWVLDFPCMEEHVTLHDGDVTLVLTHGHRPGLCPDDPSRVPAGAVMLYGHTHVKCAEERDGRLFVNPGSTSIPKDGSASYAVYDSLAGFELREL